MENRIKIKEALAFYTSCTGDDIKKDLAVELFPAKTKQSSLAQFRDFATSKETMKFMKRARIICEKCGVDGKFLLGF